MQSLASRIDSHLAPLQANSSELVSSARSAYAKRGFSELGGPYYADLSERAVAAMESVYEACFAALVEQCALSARPSTEFAQEFLTKLSESIDRISRAVVPEVGGSNTSSGRAVEAKARSLINLAKQRSGAF